MTDMPQNTSTPAAETATPVEARLEQILLEAEASLRSLREELEEQRRFAQQHQQIDRLPEHLAQTSHKWAGVKIFLDDLVSGTHCRCSSIRWRGSVEGRSAGELVGDGLVVRILQR